MNESAITGEVLAILQARGWKPAEGYKKNDGGQAAVIEVRHRQKGRGAFRVLKARVVAAAELIGFARLGRRDCHRVHA